MPYQKCKICNAEFYAKPNWIRKGHGKYCSNKCSYESRKNGKVMNCFICNKETYKPQKELRASKSKKYFCSKSCQTIWRNSMVYVGENHPNWKNGENKDYRKILTGNKIKPICKLCHCKDKRVLCAHHLDKDRKNNSLSNLIWLCYNCHHLVHNYKNAI